MTFRMWSLFHIIFILSPFIFAAIMYYVTNKYNYQKNRKIGIILSIICIVILLLRNIEIFIKSGKINPEIIPFQICHFANFVLFFAFLKDNKMMFATAFCFNLPCAILSIIFANSLENYATILTFRGGAYILGHMLIVGLTIWGLLVGFMKFTKKDIINGMVFILFLFVLSIPINNIFNKLMPDGSANYFYTMKPEGGTPLELMYNLGKVIKVFGIEFNLVYIILFLILGSVVYFSIALLTKFLNNKFKFGNQVL